jgi:hypothetical protein
MSASGVLIVVALLIFGFTGLAAVVGFITSVPVLIALVCGGLFTEALSRLV